MDEMEALMLELRSAVTEHGQIEGRAKETLHRKREAMKAALAAGASIEEVMTITGYSYEYVRQAARAAGAQRDNRGRPARP